MKHINFLAMILVGLMISTVLPLAAQTDLTDNKAIVTRYIEELFNAGDTSLMDEFFAENSPYHDSYMGLLPLVNYANFIEIYHDPPYELEMTDYTLLAQGDLVAELYTLRRTLRDMVHSAATIDILRMEDGQIAELWTIWDQTYFSYTTDGLEELGLLPEVPVGWFSQLESSVTTADENLALVEQAVQMWTSGLIEDNAEVYAENLVVHLPLSVSTEPLDFRHYVQYVSWLHQIMPDFSIETKNRAQVAEGNLVVYSYRWKGTYTVGPSRPSVILAEAADLYRIQDGKIAEVWWHWDSQNAFNRQEFAPPTSS